MVGKCLSNRRIGLLAKSQNELRHSFENLFVAGGAGGESITQQVGLPLSASGSLVIRCWGLMWKTPGAGHIVHKTRDPSLQRAHRAPWAMGALQRTMEEELSAECSTQRTVLLTP